MQMLKTPTIRGMVFLESRRGQQTPSDISPLGQWDLAYVWVGL